MKDENMATHKRINITIHPEDLQKLDMIAKKRGYTRSGMISKLIQEYPDVKKGSDERMLPGSKAYEEIGELTEMDYYSSDK